MRTLRLSLTWAVIVVLLAGLGGATVAQESEMASMPDDGTVFPTGAFVAAEWSDRFVEFDEDGICRWTWPSNREVMSCTYSVEST